MKEKKRRRRRHAHYAGPPAGPVEELAAQLAPPEERSASRAAQAGANNNGGAIVVDTGALKLPGGIAAERRESRLAIDRVVLAILLLMLAFTAFIAWQITRMPEDEPQPVRVVQPDEGK